MGRSRYGRRLARPRERAARRPHLGRGLAVDVGHSLLDEPLGELVQPIVIVRRVVAVLAPVEPKPTHRRRNGVLELDIFLDGVGVVETQIAVAAILGGEPEVEADGLRVTIVQIAIGFGWKASNHFAAVLARAIVLGDDGAKKIGSGRWPARRP